LFLTFNRPVPIEWNPTWIQGKVIDTANLCQAPLM